MKSKGKIKQYRAVLDDACGRAVECLFDRYFSGDSAPLDQLMTDLQKVEEKYSEAVNALQAAQIELDNA